MDKGEEGQRMKKPIRKLDEVQITFIQNKVRELGSAEKAKKFYSRTDAVSAYALKYAKEIFDEDKKRSETV